MELPFDLEKNLFILALLACVDHLLIKPLLEVRLKQQEQDAKDVKAWERAKNGSAAARWFFVHAIANFMVVATGFVSIVSVIRDPFNAMDTGVNSDRSVFGNASKWPMIIINAVHGTPARARVGAPATSHVQRHVARSLPFAHTLAPTVSCVHHALAARSSSRLRRTHMYIEVYHMVGGFRLSSADYFHHLLFVPLCGVPGQLFQWGAISNFQAVFISGLPGGIDYLLLGLQKISRVGSGSLFAAKMYEKRFNANLNTWLRGPGVLLGTAFLYQGAFVLCCLFIKIKDLLTIRLAPLTSSSFVLLYPPSDCV